MSKISKKTKITIIVSSIILLIAIIFAVVKLYPLIRSINLTEFEEKLEIYIKNAGWKGVFILLFLQVLQVFVAFIPGEIVEISAGVLYGPLWGTLICMLGVVLGSMAIYYSIRFLAKNSLAKYQDKLKQYSFLNNPKKIHIYFFILFVIPGIPKDIFVYLVPFLPIRFSSFLIISTIARIPTILSSTYVGDSLMSGNYLTSIIIFSIFLAIGILAILFHDKILCLFKKRDKANINKEDNIEN